MLAFLFPSNLSFETPEQCIFSGVIGSAVFVGGWTFKAERCLWWNRVHQVFNSSIHKTAWDSFQRCFGFAKILLDALGRRSWALLRNHSLRTSASITSTFCSSLLFNVFFQHWSTAPRAYELMALLHAIKTSRASGKPLWQAKVLRYPSQTRSDS